MRSMRSQMKNVQLLVAVWTLKKLCHVNNTIIQE